MKTLFSRSGIFKKVFIMPLMLCALFIYSCRSNAQEHGGSEKNHAEESHVEGRGHDSDGHNHGSEFKGHDRDHNHKTMRGEHARDKNHGGEGEEDGIQFGLDDTYDVTKHGVRLVLGYDRKSNSFKGEMENTTNKTIKRARVEVHLSNGTELGPTTPVDLKAKTRQDIVLKATKAGFESWSAHAEVGNLEHGGEKEGKEGHDGNGKEHG